MKAIALSLTALVAATAFLSLAPTASAGCSVTQTCAIITGSGGCTVPPGSCSGSWEGHCRALTPGTCTLYRNGVFDGFCSWLAPTGCSIFFSDSWSCETDVIVYVLVATAPSGGATDTMTLLRC